MFVVNKKHTLTPNKKHTLTPNKKHTLTPNKKHTLTPNKKHTLTCMSCWELVYVLLTVSVCLVGS
jgi:hypothetical protein